MLLKINNLCVFVVFLLTFVQNSLEDIFSGAIGGPSFSKSQLYNINSDVNLLNVDGYLAAYGDFNSDKFTDIFVVNQNNSTVYTYLWSEDSWRFSQLKTATIDYPDEYVITNVAPGDFNYDGVLDVLVTFKISEDNPASTLKLYIGDYENLVEKDSMIPSCIDQITVLDANRDLKLDLFGTEFESKSRKFWINQGDGTFVLEDQGAALQKPLSSPNANSFVDLNGDCVADLFVVSQKCFGVNDCYKNFEIWINKDSGFEFHSEHLAPKGTGQPTFADFGSIDIIFPVCYPETNCSIENSVRIVYGVQKKLCGSKNANSNNCISATNLCEGDIDFKFGTFNSTQIFNPYSLKIREFNNNQHTFWKQDLVSAPVLRIGDFNIDSFPDILITIYDEATKETLVEIWKNEECTEFKCGKDATNNNLRTLVPNTNSGTEALKKLKNPTTASFFDFNEQGKLGIFVNTNPADNTNNIEALFNNFEEDAFFLKTLGLNGVCPANCPSEPTFPDPRPYGVNFPGGVFKYTISDLNGDTHMMEATQLQSSSYLSLQTPYTLFGLGRVSNYVEQLFYGAPVQNDSPYKYWIGVTPNSQVVSFPWEPNSPSGWILELYITPSGITLWVTVATLSWLLATGIIICFLKWREKREDRLESEEMAHLFSFKNF